MTMAETRQSGPEWRTQLHAKIHAQRAALMESLIGLEASVLVGEPMMDGFTAKDLLAHIAAWDELFTYRIEMILSGRASELAGVEMDERNAVLYQERKDWPLEKAVYAFVTARRDFLAALAQVSDEDLHRVQDLPWGQDTIRSWSQYRHRHDRAHAADITAWRKGRDPLPGTTPKPIILAALEAGRDELMATAALIPAEARATRKLCGDWALPDILGHVADWNEFAALHLRPLTTGQLPTVHFGSEIQTWNSEHAEARRLQPREKIWADLSASAQSLETVFGSISEPDLSRPFASPWRPTDTAHQWFQIWFHHYREHALEIRKGLTLEW